MKLLSSFGVCVISLAFAGQILAYNIDHGSFASDASIKRIPLAKMRIVDKGDNNATTALAKFAVTNDPGTQIVVHIGNDGAYVELLIGNKPVFQKSRFTDFNFQAGIEAYCADLNQAGKRDFAVYASSGGCGLASGYTDIAFLLSEQNTYRLTTVQTLWPNPDNYLVLSGKPCFIHTAFENVEKCNDGKEHNFWIYNILVIETGNMRLDNNLAPEFPKTIWFTHKPNHQETTIITVKQKAEFIRAAQKDIFRHK
jgi:hypothetical protein